MFDARAFALDLLHEPTERDKQLAIGASQFASPCTYCVANALVPHVGTKPRNTYWLAAVIGTGVHLFLEDKGAKVPGAIIEKKVTLGSLPGYGVIKSKPDFYHGTEQALIDWKTTERIKLKFLKDAARSEREDVEPSGLISARFTFAKYRGQLMSYGRGLIKSGHPVKSVHMVFVCRDGKTDDDVWAHDEPYDADYAEKIFDRLTRLWEYVSSGKDVSALPSAPGCYTCEVEGR